jgi:hypothetical protein
MAFWDRQLSRAHKKIPPGGTRSWTPARGIQAGFAAALLVLVAGGVAQAAEPDKSQYTLFNPTPDRLLRDLTTDRPDTTESPFTVDAGRVQVETNIFGYTRSRPDIDGTVTDSYDFLVTNVRVGLTHNSEFNFVFQPYGIVRTRPLDPLTATRNAQRRDRRHRPARQDQSLGQRQLREAGRHRVRPPPLHHPADQSQQRHQPRWR